MFNSFLEKFRSPLQQQQELQQEQPLQSASTPRDQEEDGFLVVGETASERNTILPPHLAAARSSDGGCFSPPPSYQSQVHPSSAASGWLSHPALTPTPSSPTVSETNQQSSHRPTTYAALVMDGVPFRLSEELNFAQKMATDMSYFAVPPVRNYDPSKYFYDFEHERSVIRETTDMCD